MTEQHVRMGDAERSQASAELGEHYAQGRLTTEEHAERLDQIWAAKTRGELGPIFADLPGGTSLRPAPAYAAGRGPSRSRVVGAAGRRFRGLPPPVAAVLVVLIVVAVIAHLPLILLGLGVWFLLARRGTAPPRGCRTGAPTGLDQRSRPLTVPSELGRVDAVCPGYLG